MRILVTGAAGFIGHHIVEHLLEHDHFVVGLDRVDETSTMARLPRGHSRFSFVWHDLRSPINYLVASMIGDVDIILHLAASTHVERSIRNSLSFVMDNVVGTAHVLEFAKDLEGLRLFLNFSTDEVFGPAEDGVKYSEGDRYDARNPYSATKAGAEELVSAYGNTYGIPTITTHCMNAIGERQHPEKFVPHVIRSMLRGEEIAVHVSPEGEPGSRFYIDVRDISQIVHELITAFEPVNLPKKLNIPGVVEMDNLAMVQTIAKHVPAKLLYRLEDFHSTRPGHDLRYALDGALLRSMGLDDYTPFRESIGRIVRWYLSHKEWLLL